VRARFGQLTPETRDVVVRLTRLSETAHRERQGRIAGDPVPIGQLVPRHALQLVVLFPDQRHGRTDERLQRVALGASTPDAEQTEPELPDRVAPRSWQYGARGLGFQVASDEDRPVLGHPKQWILDDRVIEVRDQHQIRGHLVAWIAERLPGERERQLPQTALDRSYATPDVRPEIRRQCLDHLLRLALRQSLTLEVERDRARARGPRVEGLVLGQDAAPELRILSSHPVQQHLALGEIGLDRGRTYAEVDRREQLLPGFHVAARGTKAGRAKTVVGGGDPAPAVARRRAADREGQRCRGAETSLEDGHRLRFAQGAGDLVGRERNAPVQPEDTDPHTIALAKILGDRASHLDGRALGHERLLRFA
jgi:hypothetical protein